MSERSLTLNEQLRVAVENNDLPEVKRLIAVGANCSNNETDARITNVGLLRSATSSGHLLLVKYLVEEEGTKADQDHEDHWTPLFYAAANGHLEIVRYFIEEQGVNPSSTDEYGMTPLHAACLRGHPAIVEYLIEKQKLDVMAKRDDNYIPLYDAYRGGSLDVVKYFIEQKGFSPTMALNSDGVTGLHVAVKYGHVILLEYLLNTHNVDKLTKDNQGKNAADYAQHYQDDSDDDDCDIRFETMMKLLA